MSKRHYEIRKVGKPACRTKLGTSIQLKRSCECVCHSQRAEMVKAKMKLSVLQDNQHTDEDKKKRLNQIDLDIRQTEEIMKHDLEYKGLLIP